MKWARIDIEVYLKEQEYIDTTIVPIVPIDWGNGMKSTVTEGEFVMTLSQEVERQLRGRIIHSPPFTYVKHEPIQERLKRLKEWELEIKNNNVKHVLFLTSDVEWKQVENEIDWLLWFAAIPIEQMEKNYQETIVKEHVEQILRSVTTHWQN